MVNPLLPKRGERDFSFSLKVFLEVLPRKREREREKDMEREGRTSYSPFRDLEDGQPPSPKGERELLPALPFRDGGMVSLLPPKERRSYFLLFL